MFVQRAYAADAPDVFVDVVPPVDDAAPGVRATIVDGPSGPCTLDVTGTPLVPIIETGFDREQPLALVIVINDQETMLARHGYHDEWTPDDDVGPIDRIAAGFDQFDFARLGAASSRFAVIGYSTGAELLQPFAPLAELKGHALGTRQQYRNKLGTDLVQGIAMGLDQLAKAPEPRRAMIVIGDGNDTNNETAVKALGELAMRARAEHVETYALVYKSVVSSEGMVVGDFAHTASVASEADIVRELAHIMQRLAARRTLTFDGTKLPWDRRSHVITIACDGKALPPIALTLAPAWSRPVAYVWWLWIKLGALLVMTAVLAWFVFRRMRFRPS